jgi:thioredoxin reductase
MTTTTRKADVLIVGGGPAGLAAALELRKLGIGTVLVADREAQAGGIPRHSDHIGFGLGDMRRFMSGPAYAERYVRLAEEDGVEIVTETTITGWEDSTHLTATSPAGLTTIEARAVLLATGCRERPRAARLVPGSRPQGVYTTGAMQNMVYGHHQKVGKRAIIVGAEHVSFSAVLTLKHAGAETVALVTDLPCDQSFLQYKLISTERYGVPVWTHTKLTRIVGRARVEAVELTSVIDGSARLVECDTVVFTGDWIPDYELAFYGSLSIDPAAKAPVVNQRLQTSTRGVFAAGNLIHAAETADVAALSGRYAARCVDEYLHDDTWLSAPPIPIQLDEVFAWMSPSQIVPGEEHVPHGHFILRVKRVLELPTVEIWQGERRLWRKLYRRMVPNLPVYISDSWLRLAYSSDQPIRFEITY